MTLVMAAIFVADTTTHYEVAIAVFYAVVILAATRVLGRHALLILSVTCLLLTWVSFAMTPHGTYHIGLVNLAISNAAIVVTAYLVVKMEAARMAAQAMQEQLMRIARGQSLEGLTTSIAHELNQPLAAITTSGHACQRWLAQQPPNLEKAGQTLERIVRDAGRASEIIARVRSLTKGELPHRTAFDFNEAVLEVLTLSQELMQTHEITLNAELDDQLPPALADRVQIQQVVGNLVLNAIDALTLVSKRRRNITLTTQVRDGRILFAIADTGVGIAAGLYEHLFDAFWTTKKDGIGIGLSISRTIIEANRGQIWAESNASQGALFLFNLPIAKPVQEPAG